MAAAGSLSAPNEAVNDTRLDLSRYFDERLEEGVYRIDRSVYTDPALFELEMKAIFEGTWIYLAHESQLAKPHDYFTTSIGRQPIILTRGKAGNINGFINACSHRGALLARLKKGNLPVLSCSYHGWCFSSDGELAFVQRQTEGYPEHFKRSDLNLVRVPKLASYRGFIFGSLNPNVPSLEEHLAGAAPVIDMLADQSEDGIEVLKGSSTCWYRGNWKLLMDNGGGDGLHPDYTHSSLMTVLNRRNQREGQLGSVRLDQLSKGNAKNGLYCFGNGHTLILAELPNPEQRPVFAKKPELTQKFGPARAEWMTSRFRQIGVYPNVHIMDQLATLIRYIRPVAVDKTEVTFWCIAPRGEERSTRTKRIRQFEEFFHASGMGASDDNAEFEACQAGSMGASARWSYTSFGMHSRTVGGDEDTMSVNVPVSHHGKFGYEGQSLEQFRQWRRLLAIANNAPAA